MDSRYHFKSWNPVKQAKTAIQKKMVNARLDSCVEANPEKEVEVAKWADEQVILDTTSEDVDY